MNTEIIKQKIEGYKAQGLKIFTSSSFQTHSIPLLHIISRIDNTIQVYFINTGYHFTETLDYRDEVAELLGLNLKILYSPISRINQRDTNGKLLYASDPDYCCYINKVAPLEPVLAEYDVWINGVRKSQSNVRKNFEEEQKAKFGVLRYHPVLGWTDKMIYQYLNEFNLPRHPLEDKGYISIGCEPCTRKWNFDNDERGGRWFGLKKTECGLNTEMVEK